MYFIKLIATKQCVYLTLRTMKKIHYSSLCDSTLQVLRKITTENKAFVIKQSGFTCSSNSRMEWWCISSHTESCASIFHERHLSISAASIYYRDSNERARYGSSVTVKWRRLSGSRRLPFTSRRKSLRLWDSIFLESLSLNLAWEASLDSSCESLSGLLERYKP